MDASAEARLNAVVAHSADAALLCDANVVISYASSPVTSLFGWTPDEVIGCSGLEFVHPDDLSAALDVVARTLARSGPQPPFELRLRTPDGSYVWSEAVISNQLDEPDAKAVVINLRNIAQRKAAERALATSEKRFRDMVEAAEEGVWQLDASDRGVFANARLEQMLGISAGALTGRLAAEFVHPNDVTVLQDQLAQRRSGKRSRYECRLVTQSGEVIHVLISGHPLFADDGTYLGAQALLTDISPLKAALARLQTLAVRDEQTGLPNAALMREHIEACLSGKDGGSTHCALLLVHVDHLGTVDDSLGVGAGDEVLVALAHRLEAQARPQDVVGRLASGELAVLCRGVKRTTDARRIATRMSGVTAEPVTIRDSAVVTTVSIGIAQSPSPNAEALLRDAAAAAHQAREQGVGRVAVYSGMLRQRTHLQLGVIADLDRALKCAEFELHYQPILSLATVAVAGAEALIRWRHPERGLLVPDQFIGVAERSGQIVKIEEWVLGAAMTALAGWRARGQVSDDFRVAVNISGAHLSQRGFSDHVAAVLEAASVPAALLTLELTETALVTGREAATEAMEDLRRLGVRFAIDDFGTGYASLDYLRMFPVDALKVDKSFVADLGTAPAADALVGSVVALAHAVGIDCVGEGIETAGQRERLRELGCVFGQGYLWSKPVPCEELPDVVTSLDTSARAFAG